MASGSPRDAAALILMTARFDWTAEALITPPGSAVASIGAPRQAVSTNDEHKKT